MLKKSISFMIVLLCLLFAQQETAFAKKSKHKTPKPAVIELVPSDPMPIESTSTAAPIPQSGFAMIPDLGCSAGNMKVDFSAKNFSFAAYLASSQSSALDAVP
jgi:hypothetical protein